MNASSSRPFWLKCIVTIIGILLTLKVIAFLWWGTELASEGGSTYYVISGVIILVAELLFLFGNATGTFLYLLWLVGTVIWAFSEVGLNFWMMFPRIFEPIVSALIITLVTPFQTGRKLLPQRKNSKKWQGASIILVACTAALFADMFVEHDPTPDNSAASHALIPTQSVASDDIIDTPDAMKNWTSYAGNDDRNAYVPYNQINIHNVRHLKVAWRFHTGDIASTGAEDQNTPLQIGDTLYSCSPHDHAFAINADTGKQLWTFNAEASAPPIWYRCRSLAYADLTHDTYAVNARAHSQSSNQSLPQRVDTPATGHSGMCEQRIYMGTMDARLIALDAKTGQRCAAFGNKGEVNLKVNMGKVSPGFYMQTSGPTVVDNGLVIIAGWVMDNYSVGEPSGVVRAYDANSGKLVWAGDMGNPDIHTTPPAGQTYTRGTPNMWAFPAVDDKLGLVYLPLGNETPDYWGGERSKVADAYNSSVVAVDIYTGRERWKFQTTHHDTWDYDLPTHPILYDMPDGQGHTLPALLQATKRGEIFVLDRRTGKPITQVDERPVPTDHLPQGEYLSPTQPYSVGMPAIRNPPFTERDMWGITPVDQLICRVEFHRYRYQGDFTPQSTQGTIQYPSNAGGMNWGDMSIDRRNGYLIVNDTRIAMTPQLVPQAEAGKYSDSGDNGHLGFSPELGTPYGVLVNYFLSPLGIPCNAPPYGTLTAIDLKTRQIVWQKPLGTVQDTGPLGLATHLPIPIGMPSLGGALTTGGGLLFYSATQDHAIRAYNAATGKVIWKARLPVGGQSTPMSYISPVTGKQYIVVTASGGRGQSQRGDNIIAYTLDNDDNH